MINTIHYHNFGPAGFELNMPLKINQINLVAGQNGSGKTLVLKSTWFMLFALNMYKVIGMLNIPNSDEVFKHELEGMFDLTFNSKEKLSGAIMIEDLEGTTVKFMINVVKGKIDYFSVDVVDPEKFRCVEVTQINYNTKEARTFNQYESYRKIKKKLGIVISDMASIKEIGEFYKLYDIMWFENMEHSLNRYEKNPDIIQTKIQTWIDKFNADDSGSDMPDMSTVFFRNGSMFFSSDKDPEIKVSDLSTGVQSLIMLTFMGTPDD